MSSFLSSSLNFSGMGKDLDCISFVSSSKGIVCFSYLYVPRFGVFSDKFLMISFNLISFVSGSSSVLALFERSNILLQISIFIPKSLNQS